MKWNVAGHTHIRKALEQQIEQGSLAHAYLFVGSEHLGKTHVAYELAQTLICKIDTQNPCGTCRDCMQFSLLTHPDVHHIAREDTKKLISIEQIIALQKKIQLKSAGGNWTVSIIEHAGELSLEAANRLLKVLEEPPPATIFILTATTLGDILPTIQSRTQILQFTIPSVLELQEYFAQQVALDEFPDMLRVAQYKPGLMKSFVADPQELQQQIDRIEQAVAMVTESPEKRLRLAQQLVPNNASYTERLNTLQFLLSVWQQLVHDLFLLHHSLDDKTMLPTNTKSLLSRYPLSTLQRIGTTLHHQVGTLKFNPDIQTTINYTQLLFN